MDRIAFLNEITDILLISHRINRSLRHCRENKLMNSISPMQMQALLTIMKQEVLTMGELAAQMMVTRQQLTRLVDTLVDKGHVRRESDPQNRRYVLIRMTREGGEFLRDMLLQQASIFARLLDQAGEEDAQRFFDAVHTIKDIMSRHQDLFAGGRCPQQPQPSAQAPQ